MADIVASFHVDDACCCSGTPPAGCSCALLIPPFGSPYADYATAAAAIADNTSNCVGYITEDHAGTYGSFAATVGTASLQLAGNGDGSATPTLNMWASINLLSGDVVTATFSAGMGPFPGSVSTEFSLYSCDGTLIETIGPGDSPLAFSAVTADGEYIVRSSSTASGMGVTYAACDVTFTSSGSLTVNPVISQWNDSGTTRQLEACPKLLLPPLTEGTGDWYADCASADAVLTGSGVSNCVGYTTPGPGLASFTATDGGTSLTLANTISPAGAGGISMWGGVNAVGGQTLTFTGTVGSGTVGLYVTIYDNTGIVVEDTAGFVASAFVSAALPYTGRYTFHIRVNTDDSTTSFSCVVTSSGTMSVNPIQALWDGGLTCPNRLDCGDSCP